MYKKLYRKKEGRKLLGVCAGMADYLNVDPTIVRVIWIILSITGGLGLLAYFICAFIIPEEPDNVIDAN